MKPTTLARFGNVLRRSALQALTAILAIICMGLAVALYDSFVKLQLARIFPTGYLKEAAASPQNGGGGPTLALWGDSRAAQWDKNGIPCGLSPRDHAVGGLTSAQLALQLKNSPLVRDDYALAQIGINDLHPLGALPGLSDEIVAQLRGNVVLIREEMLRRANIVVLSTVVPPSRVPLLRRPTWDPVTSRRIREINELIRSQADGDRVFVLDAYTLLVGADDYLDDRYVGDFFLHLNDLAYSRLNQQLRVLVAARWSGCR